MNITDFNDGIRLRHWVDWNSVKIYKEQNNLQIETTINNPERFKVFRHKQGQDENKAKQRLPILKGVLDTPLRATVSQDVGNRLTVDLSTMKKKTPICDIMDDFMGPITKDDQNFRGLDTVGKDREFLDSLADPAYSIG